MLEERLIELRKSLTMYATHAEEMLKKSIEGLLKKDENKLTEVIVIDEAEANATEIRIDQLCTSLIAQYQPTATNLRMILMGMKINNDLERVADHAVNIAQSAEQLIIQPAVKPLIDIPRMAEIARGMLSAAVTAFLQEDTQLAQEVRGRDKEVNQLRNQILRELITYMSAEPRVIERALHLIRISSNLERIADLATNIGEDVVFIVEGKVVKHPGVNK